MTIPHKEAVLALCAPDELAARVGAVNTLVFAGERPAGYNTDVHGFLEMAREVGAPLDGTVVMLGAGGARARGRARRCTASGKLAIVARTPRDFRVDGTAMTVTPWNDERAGQAAAARRRARRRHAARAFDADAPAIDLSSLPAHAVVLDLVVARETALTRAAQARGLKAAAGGAMLLHQGARALELWTGQPAPIEVMRQALDAAL